MTQRASHRVQLLLVLGLIGLPRPCTASPRATPDTEVRRGLSRFEHEVMGTVIEVLFPRAGEPGRGEDAAREVFKVFDEVNRQMSEWNEASPVSAINRGAGGVPVNAPAELRAILGRAREVSERSGGAFDVTWATLAGLWDFQAISPHRPSAAEIERATSLVDYRMVEVDEAAGTVRLARPGMKIGLGGIAKGYALARAAAVLRSRAVRSFLLSAGGQVLAEGGEAEAGPWRVGIRDPRGTRHDFFAVIELDRGSVSTSGDYERYFHLDGERYHHILDPRTGTPSRGLRAATVVAPDPVLADALSTAVMVLGRERGLNLAATFPDVEALVVDEHGGVQATPGLDRRLRIVHSPREQISIPHEFRSEPTFQRGRAPATQ